MHQPQAISAPGGVCEYRGAIHVHTVYSDGSGTMPEIVRAAAGRGLDFVVITDHWSLRARQEGWERWHGRLLVLVGAELHGAEEDVHYLAVGASATPPPAAGLGEGQLARHVRRHQGRLFLAHPQGVPRTLFTNWSRPWHGRIDPAVDGLEIWSYMHDWLEAFRAHRALRFHRRHADEITGPNPVVLSAWDRLAQERPVAALAGLDNHARLVPFTRIAFLPYEALFGTLATHVLLPHPLTGRVADDVRAVTEALGRGRSFMANDALADATGFRFEAEGAAGLAGPGEACRLGRGVVMQVTAPVAAEWRLVCAGRVVAHAHGRHLQAAVRAPGAYHVQGRIADRWWLLTNPIHVTGSPGRPNDSPETGS